VALIGGVAAADWDPDDPYKMHFPQLPDPSGWDVAFYTDGGTISGGFVPAGPIGLADDWLCSGTGHVTDIHFWVSWKGDDFAPFNTVSVKIYSDDPIGDGGTRPENTFSQPDKVLWQRVFTQSQFSMRPYGFGDQGWLDPAYEPATAPADHHDFWQVNIIEIEEPFLQKAGTVYWLGLNIDPPGPTYVGWKTADVMSYPPPFTGEHFMDDAVFTTITPVGMPTVWHELYDPVTGASLDLAFVITPEPATMALVSVGLAIVAARRRMR
jgi:hypothetical protein